MGFFIELLEGLFKMTRHLTLAQRHTEEAARLRKAAADAAERGAEFNLLDGAARRLERLAELALKKHEATIKVTL